MYRTVNVFTKDMGEVGDQILLAKFDKIDAQNSSGAYLKTVKVSALVSEEDGGTVTSGTAGFIIYATTSAEWNDDYIITACGIQGGAGSGWLAVRRPIKTDYTGSAQEQGVGGPVYLWGEVTDIGESSVDCRFVIETIARYCETHEL